MSEPANPQRAFTLTINVGGDTWDDVARSLQEIIDHVCEHGPECRMVSGSPAVGFSVAVEHRPEQTHDKYFADIEEWKMTRKYYGVEQPTE